MPAKKRAGDELAPEHGDEPFERALEKLEAIVQQMEQGEMPLDRLVAKYEEGVALVRKCGTTLNAAEERVRRISLDSAGALAVDGFPGAGDSADGEQAASTTSEPSGQQS